MRQVLIGALLLVSSVVAVSRDDKDAERMKVLRNDVLRDLLADEDKSIAVAGAYKKLFAHVGIAGLPKLVEDEDTSIALQAAWELHRKAVKREPPIQNRTDWVFDKKPMEQFLKVLGKRLKSDPPAWWGSTLLKGEVFPGQHHAFTDLEKQQPPTATVIVGKDEVVITAGKQSVRMPKADFEKDKHELDIGAPVALCEADLSFIAHLVFRGYPFKLVGVDSKQSKRLWSATVWAARRGFSSGPPGVSPVEVRRHGDTVIVYGSESHGMYIEGFDSKTGKCRFRFCSCYWFNFPEKWDLK
jgi:hypothetical protein